MNKDLMASKTASITPEVVTLTSEAILAWLATSPSDDNTLRTSTLDTHLWIAPSGTERSIVVGGLDGTTWRLISKVLVPAYEPVLVPLFWPTIRLGASENAAIVCGCTSQANLLAKPVMQISEDSTTTTIAKEAGGNLESLLAAVSGIECLDVFNKTIEDFAAEGAVAITATPATCKFVHISAPFNTVTQTAKNTSVVLVGITGAGNRLRKLHPSDIDGFDFPCTDPREVFIEAFADGDGVDVEVFGVPS